MGAFVYPSEIPSMLSSIKKDVKKWMIAPDVVVIYEDDGWGIYDGWTLQDPGECIVWAHRDKEIIPEIREIMEERGWA
jgi:hypothetical protein